MIDVLEKTEIKLLRLSKQVTNNEYIITIVRDNQVMQVGIRNIISDISNTRKSVLSSIQTPRSGLKKKAQPSFFYNRLQGVWIPDKILLRVFDIASQTDH